MNSFSKYVESRDGDDLKRRGLDPRGMRIIKKKKRVYQDQEILGSKYLYLNVPEDHSDLADKLRHANGQVVARDEHYHSDRNGVWVNLLTGRGEEGNSYRVPFDWLKPVRSKSGESHGDWLGKTFFHRSSYVAKDKTSSDSWKYEQKIHLSTEEEDILFKSLKHLDASTGSDSVSMRQMTTKISQEEEVGAGYVVADLMVVADMLLDLGKTLESNEIRDIVSSYLNRTF